MCIHTFIKVRLHSFQNTFILEIELSLVMGKMLKVINKGIITLKKHTRKVEETLLGKYEKN